MSCTLEPREHLLQALFGSHGRKLRLHARVRQKVSDACTMWSHMLPPTPLTPVPRLSDSISDACRDARSKEMGAKCAPVADVEAQFAAFDTAGSGSIVIRDTLMAMMGAFKDSVAREMMLVASSERLKAEALAAQAVLKAAPAAYTAKLEAATATAAAVEAAATAPTSAEGAPAPIDVSEPAAAGSEPVAASAGAAEEEEDPLLKKLATLDGSGA